VNHGGGDVCSPALWMAGSLLFFLCQVFFIGLLFSKYCQSRINTIQGCKAGECDGFIGTILNRDGDQADDKMHI